MGPANIRAPTARTTTQATRPANRNRDRHRTDPLASLSSGAVNRIIPSGRPSVRTMSANGWPRGSSEAGTASREIWISKPRPPGIQPTSRRNHRPRFATRNLLPAPSASRRMSSLQKGSGSAPAVQAIRSSPSQRTAASGRFSWKGKSSFQRDGSFCRTRNPSPPWISPRPVESSGEANRDANRRSNRSRVGISSSMASRARVNSLE